MSTAESNPGWRTETQLRSGLSDEFRIMPQAVSQQLVKAATDGAVFSRYLRMPLDGENRSVDILRGNRLDDSVIGHGFHIQAVAQFIDALTVCRCDADRSFDNVVPH